jgi:L-amino acid N-acyltransferase YncA
MRIRPVSEADLDAITEIYAEAVRNGTGSYELDPPDRNEMADRMAAVAKDGFPYLVAETGGNVLGFAYASHFRTRPAYRFIVEDSVYIAPDAKGQGVGKALLAALIERCGQLGFWRMVAVIGDGGVNTASVALHRSLGFEECGRMTGSGFKHGRWLDTVLMQRDLSAATDALPSERNFPAHFTKPERA